MKPHGIDGSPNPIARMMTGLATVAVSAFFAAMVLRHYLPQDEPSLIHLIMAIGIMPLIMGAMIYFTPVLTHSRTPGWIGIAGPWFVCFWDWPRFSSPCFGLNTGWLSGDSTCISISSVLSG